MNIRHVHQRKLLDLCCGEGLVSWAYSYGTPKEIKARHVRVIAATHHMLFASGKSFVIENVPGAKKDLRPNAEMNGLYFSLPISRPRYFRVSGLTAPLRLIKPGRGMRVHGGDYVDRERLIEAFGLENIVSRHSLKLMTRDGIKQGIPPVFTKTLATMLFDRKVMIG